MNSHKQSKLRSFFDNMRLSKTVLNLIFTIAIILLILLSILSYRQVLNLIDANGWVNHTYQVIQQIDESLYRISDIESQQRGYLISGDEQLLNDFDKIKDALKGNLEQANQLTIDNSDQGKRVALFDALINQRLDFLNQTIRLKSENKLTTPQGSLIFSRGQTISNRLKALGDEIKAVELVLLKERNDIAINRVDTTSFVLVIGNIFSLLFLIMAFILTNMELMIRKKAEVNNYYMQTRLRRIIESASDMIAAFDKNYRFIIFNEAYQREFKYLFGKSIMVGMSIDELFASLPEDKKQLSTQWKNSLEKNEYARNLEVNTEQKRGIYELTSSLVQNHDNEVIGSVQSIRNITKRMQEHQELQKSYESLATGMKELQNKNEQITLLVEMSDIMLACSSQDELSRVMTKYSQRMLDFSSGYLYVMHPSKNYLEVATSWGTPNKQESTFTPSECWAIKLGRKHHVGIGHKELVCDHIRITDQQQSSFLCIPLMAQNDIYGLLYLEMMQEKQVLIDENQQLLVNAFAELTALALANVRLRDNLRYQSIRDPLTGLYNRRYLEDFLFKQAHQAERSGLSFAILMLDLDHFKKINDTFGHDAGDATLKELTKVLQSEIRAGDIAARYGGEEFIIMFYNIDTEMVKKRAEAIRSAVSLLHVKYGAQQVGAITVSIGIAQYPIDGKTPNDLIEVADKALYYAKKNGRNQVVLATDIGDKTAS